jgi:type I restriction enzyme S subunit
MNTTTQTRVPVDVSTDADSNLPDGWALPTLNSLLTVNYGKGLKESLRKAGSVLVYGSNGVVGEHTEPLTAGPTIIIGRKGTVGAVHFSPQSCWPIDTTFFIEEFHSLDPLYLTTD